MLPYVTSIGDSMFVADNLYTAKTATEVGSMLKYMFEHPEDERYLELATTKHSPGQEAEEEIFYVRLIDNPADRVIALANGREIVRCRTRNNKKLDIVFGDISEREIEPALVLIEP